MNDDQECSRVVIRPCVLLKTAQFFTAVVLVIFIVITQSVSAQTSDECLECHADKALTGTVNGKEVSVFVAADAIGKSIHDGVECVDCHVNVSVDHDEDLPIAECTGCHDDAIADYNESVHAQPVRSNSPRPASCADCHGGHDIMAVQDAGSLVNQANLSKTCGKCHSKMEVMTLFTSKGRDPIASYEKSIHAKKLKENPNIEAATCVACHGSHRILPPSHPNSTFSKFEIPKICGKCHAEAEKEFTMSIHWRSVLRGHVESPVCTDCHGEHQIVSPTDKDALTHPSLLSSQLCANCHANKTMMARHGLDPERFISYMKTYHGLAILKGSPDAANCTSCHEVHAIRSQVDSLSSVYKSTLPKTCGKCHENVTAAGFTDIEVHPIDQKSRNPVAYFFKQAYIWLIVLAVGGMIAHNAVIQLYYIVEKRRRERLLVHIRRFQPFEVVQHTLLFTSFFVLVITGFSLKFPEMAWVSLLGGWGMTEAVRSNLHRMAGVVLIIISTIQLGYLLFSSKGRREIKALLPHWDDLTGFIHNMGFYLRLTPNRPQFGRFDYTEKFEYLALIWGTIIMAATGFVLWYPAQVLRLFPAWFFEVAEVIHYYEAWLATLAILIWHWYFVIFHPEKYPLNLTFLNGKIATDEQRHHHPLETSDESEPPQ